MTLTILAVDPATTTGWACSDGTSGAEDFAASRVMSKWRLAKLPEVERHGRIGLRFSDWLDAKLNLTRPGVLVVERQLTHNTPQIPLGLRMLALVAGWQRGLLVEEVWESQWKPSAKAGSTWVKGDETDAKAMLSWWTENRLPRLEEAPSALGSRRA